jgi:hypothetical protein
MPGTKSECGDDNARTRDLKWMRDYVDQRFKDAAIAVEVAWEGIEKRLDAMNEFREALRDQTNEKVDRDMWEREHKRHDDDIRVLRDASNRAVGIAEGKASQLSFLVTIIIAVGGFVMSAIAILVDVIPRMVKS